LRSRRSRILGYVRLAGVYLFIGSLVWVSRPTLSLFFAGAVLVAAGEATRIWAAGHLVKSLELIDSGPYAYTQNPLYLGRLLILTGFCVMARNDLYLNWVALVAGYLIFFGYYIPRKLRVEGGRLQKMHGEAWARYNASVPILVPSLTRYPGKRTAWSLRRTVKNQEHLVLAGILLTLAFFAWKTWGS
jgi:protein-S-isoprenylcysteine O-methyltransferase Ste14